jgi:hypothetical protein
MSEWFDVQSIASAEIVITEVQLPPRGLLGYYLCDHNNEFILDHNGEKISVELT